VDGIRRRQDPGMPGSPGEHLQRVVLEAGVPGLVEGPVGLKSPDLATLLL
jgi:hypothetical protein